GPGTLRSPATNGMLVIAPSGARCALPGLGIFTDEKVTSLRATGWISLAPRVIRMMAGSPAPAPRVSATYTLPDAGFTFTSLIRMSFSIAPTAPAILASARSMLSGWVPVGFLSPVSVADMVADCGSPTKSSPFGPNARADTDLTSGLPLVGPSARAVAAAANTTATASSVVRITSPSCGKGAGCPGISPGLHDVPIRAGMQTETG